MSQRNRIYVNWKVDEKFYMSGHLNERNFKNMETWHNKYTQQNTIVEADSKGSTVIGRPHIISKLSLKKNE